MPGAPTLNTPLASGTCSAAAKAAATSSTQVNCIGGSKSENDM